MAKHINVALIGNPNTGKSTIFNCLTKLNQKTGNYPGITVEKKEGLCVLSKIRKAHILDLPGIYSLNTNSLDENIVLELILNKNNKDYPDLTFVICEIENLKRNLLLFSQIQDLGIPTVIVINMSDKMKKRGIKIDIKKLEQTLNTKVLLVSGRKQTGIDEIKKTIEQAPITLVKKPSSIELKSIDSAYFDGLKKTFPGHSLYKLWLIITHDALFSSVSRDQISSKRFKLKTPDDIKRLQQKEIILRYEFINDALKDAYLVDKNDEKSFRSKIDKLLTHKIFGYVFLFFVLLFMFQAIYNWSSFPMEKIETIVSWASEFVKNIFPKGILVNLISEGVIPGIGGVIMFIPQIALLFLFISIMEETGYMSRIIFLMDKFMRPFGLSGKSVIPLISGVACAIPAIMASRNIENWKERLITILVTPFTTCSARLPVYLIIIALIIPDKSFGIFSLKGLVLMSLYVLGFITALVAAYILHKTLFIKQRSFFMIEMPRYKIPILKNILFTVIEKTKSFVFGAGKIIISVSIIIWFLASNGPNRPFSFNQDETQISENYTIEDSYLGVIGKTIEPVIKPLGYNWKIGIAVLNSFIAREVFISSLVTIYSVEYSSTEAIINRLKKETKEDSKALLFDLPMGISLLLFYSFAMQCISTLAVVKKETNSWKWPIIQFVFMTGFAYFIALITYQILS